MEDELRLEIDFLRASLATTNERLAEYRELLEIAGQLLKQKNVIVVRKDDEMTSNVDQFLEKLKEHGLI